MIDISIKLNTKQIVNIIKSGTLPLRPIKFFSTSDVSLSLFIKMDEKGKVGDDVIFLSEESVCYKENMVDSYVVLDSSKWYLLKRGSLPDVICKVVDVRYDVYDKKSNDSLFESDTIILNDAILIKRKNPTVEVAWYQEMEVDLRNVTYIEEISKDEVDYLKDSIRRIGVVMVPGIPKDYVISESEHK